MSELPFHQEERPLSVTLPGESLRVTAQPPVWTWIADLEQHGHRRV